MIDSVILAGGLGTRLRDVVPDLPKPLAPIQGVPFLDLLIHQLRRFKKISKVILATGYKASEISKHYEKDLFVEFSVENVPLGTGGALKKALPLTRSRDILVLNGDSYLDLPFDAFWESHHDKDADLTIACHEVDRVGRYGSLLLDADFRVRAFQEKNPLLQRGWINGGVYLLKRDLLDKFSSGEALSLEKEIFPKLLEGKVFGYPCRGTFIDIGTKESFFEAQQLLKTLIEEICHPKSAF